MACCCCYCLVTKLCRTFCNPMDYSPPSSSVQGISRQEYCGGLSFPSSPEDLPNPGIEPASPAWAGGFFTTEPPGKLRALFRLRLLSFILLELRVIK